APQSRKGGAPADHRVLQGHDLEREACARDGRRARSAGRRLARDREQCGTRETLRHRGPVPDPGPRERGRDAHLHRPGRVVTVQLLHLSDLHFGGLADLDQIESLEQMLPDLRPDAVVVTGDLAPRARHGECQRARALVQTAARTAPVLVIPGNHDVAWWMRPLIPFAKEPLYAKYARYFGADLAPTLSLSGAILASALTSHGVAWGSLTPRVRDLAVKGHLPKR